MTKKKQFAWVLVMALLTACSSTPKQAATEMVAPQLPYTIDLSEAALPTSIGTRPSVGH